MFSVKFCGTAPRSLSVLVPLRTCHHGDSFEQLLMTANRRLRCETIIFFFLRSFLLPKIVRDKGHRRSVGSKFFVSNIDTDVVCMADEIMESNNALDMDLEDG